jgi:hypothetical protein
MHVGLSQAALIYTGNALSGVKNLHKFVFIVRKMIQAYVTSVLTLVWLGLSSALISLDFGFINISTRGLEVKPQFKFGVAGDNFDVNLGIGDFRQSLSVSAEAYVQQKFYGEGDTLIEFLDNLSAANGLGKEILDPVIQALGNIINQIIDITDVDVSLNQVSGTLTVFGGVGVGASVGIGVEDPEGYRNFGAWACVGPFEYSVFAGKHTSNGSIKVAIGVPWAEIEFISTGRNVMVVS